MKDAKFEPEHPGYEHGPLSPDLRDQGQEVKSTSLVVSQLEEQTILLNDLRTEVKHLTDRLKPVCREYSSEEEQNSNKSESKVASQVALHVNRNNDQISALQIVLCELQANLEV